MKREDYEKAEKIIKEITCIERVMEHKNDDMLLEYQVNDTIPTVMGTWERLIFLTGNTKSVIIEALEKRKQELEKQLEKL